MYQTSDRFELEEHITRLDAVSEELETILSAVCDAPTPLTQDQISNMLIGVIELHKQRYERMWCCFERCIKSNHLTAKNEEPTVDS